MKFGILALVAVLAAVLTVSSATAAGTVRGGFGPGSGVGICPNPGAADDDGDGIPNGQDPDYVPPRDGTGRQWGRTPLASNFQLGAIPYFIYGPFGGFFLDASRFVAPMHTGYGPGDGTGNDGIGPGDGTGYGPGPRIRP